MLVRPEDTAEYLYNLLNINAHQIGLSYIAPYEEALIPKYPAACVVPSTVQRDIHGTHKFQLMILNEIYLYHAKLSQSRIQRTRADLDAVTRLVTILHSDPSGPNNEFIFSYVSAEYPGRLRRGSDTIITTKLTWQATVQEVFRGS